jgi:hypothetical protein
MSNHTPYRTTPESEQEFKVYVTDEHLGTRAITVLVRCYDSIYYAFNLDDPSKTAVFRRDSPFDVGFSGPNLIVAVYDYRIFDVVDFYRTGARFDKDGHSVDFEVKLVPHALHDQGSMRMTIEVIAQWLVD